jgi:predicted nucleotidyltransferase
MVLRGYEKAVTGYSQLEAARGDAGAGSDVDILVELPKGASLLDLAGLKIDLEGRLGNEVDVLTYNSIYPLLKERILSEEVAIL